MVINVAINKIKNKQGNVIGYKLLDENGNIMDASSSMIKEALKNKNIRIPNLKITSDDRLTLVTTAPSKLTKYADLFSKITGFKRGDAILEHAYAKYRFGGTKVYIYCCLDEDNIYISDGIQTKLIKSIHDLEIINKNIKKHGQLNDCNKVVVTTTELVDWTNTGRVPESLLKVDGAGLNNH